MTTTVDRPAAIRRALRDLVAERGFHGASMGAVAKHAGVAVGTAYVHYESKEELVYATFLEIKHQLGDVVLSQVDLDAPPKDRFVRLWTAIYRHYREEPARAGFLAQLEASPFYPEASRRLEESGDQLVEEATRPDLVDMLIDLPMDVIAALTLGVAVRLVAAGIELSDGQLETVAEACWRAVTVE
ncbi:MAG: TetR/AcrR family transcriptional regulator [Acidimicrobiia bacterium]|nr:TetR/AcrR family transcriptional regulator [Acidimicrobiia bacterium]